MHRGCPKKIFPFNGTNFIGSSEYLIKFKKFPQERYGQECVPQAVLNVGFIWMTIQTRAPKLEDYERQ